MTFKNMELRVQKGRIELGEIADHLGIHRNTVSRWFNDGEMDPLKREQVRRAIEEIKEKKAVG